MRGERVPQRVRRDALGEPGAPRVCLDDAPRPDPRQRRAAGVQEQEAATLPTVQGWPYLFDIHRDFANRPPPDGYETFLSSFPEYPGDPFLEEQILKLHADEL